MQTKPMQKFYRDLGNLGEAGEISPRLTISRRGLGEICTVAEISTRSQINEISPRSRRDKRDLAEITEISSRSR